MQFESLTNENILGFPKRNFNLLICPLFQMTQIEVGQSRPKVRAGANQRLRAAEKFLVELQARVIKGQSWSQVTGSKSGGKVQTKQKSSRNSGVGTVMTATGH